jgi:hypothetical protein
MPRTSVRGVARFNACADEIERILAAERSRAGRQPLRL